MSLYGVEDQRHEIEVPAKTVNDIYKEVERSLDDSRGFTGNWWQLPSSPSSSFPYRTLHTTWLCGCHGWTSDYGLEGWRDSDHRAHSLQEGCV